MTSRNHPWRGAIAMVLCVLLTSAAWALGLWLQTSRVDDAEQDRDTAATQGQRVIDCVKNPDAAPRRCARIAAQAEEAIDNLDTSAVPEIDDPDPDDPEQQDPELQQPEIQDPELQQPELDDPPAQDGAAGEQGPPGPQGEQGPPGAPGADATCAGAFVCEDELIAILADYAPRSWVIDLLTALGCELTGVGSELLTCTITGKP